MSIPRAQIENWSHRPSSSSSAHAYETVRTALSDARLSEKYRYQVYLQGSYANATNVRADSDVDVVVEMQSTFHRNISALAPDEKQRYISQALPPNHTLAEFKQDVKAALVAYYGGSLVTVGNKCLKVAASSSRIPIDVLPCQTYKYYISFPAFGYPEYIEGILFESNDGREVINYPKLHRVNGENKQSRSSDTYKATVRAFKNARRKLRDDGRINQSVSPSYFVECLLYNVPDNAFSNDVFYSYKDALTWLGNNIENFPSLLCQNGVLSLFGAEPEQWNVGDAVMLINELITQWNEWT